MNDINQVPDPITTERTTKTTISSPSSQNINNNQQPYKPVGSASSQFTAARIVWFIGGLIVTILSIRFILMLLGANLANAFANLIYTVSEPLVAPFIGIFGYNSPHYGVARFEAYTLFAIAIYALVAYGIARLITINQPKA